MKNAYLLPVFAVLFLSCQKSDLSSDAYAHIRATFGGKIDPERLANYSSPPIPPYITKSNGLFNPVTDAGATLGRVLFYDKNLSSNRTVSCASCHQQANAFSDVAVVSQGVNGLTARHSMRLVNARFSNETRFFWDERAPSLEAQTTLPIRDHGEMGFSGTNGDPPFSALLARLSEIGYYRELFRLAFGSEEITEARIQLALAQFIRSIQSFDAKYDVGRAQVMADNVPFPNFSPLENQGKQLFLAPPQFNASGVRTGGGLGCGGCHRAPEFDIDPNARNNGVTQAPSGGRDFTVTRSPSLRDLLKPDGTLNGPMMHSGTFTSLQAVIEHYNDLTPGAQNNPNLDPRLRPGGFPARLNMTPQEMSALTAFLRTLSGTNVYTDRKWSDPFQ